MANVLYNRFLARLADAYVNGKTAPTLRAALLRSTSTYSANKDHDYVSDVIGATPGGVEITASGYSRQSLANGSSTPDDTNDRANVDFDNVNFGSISAGQTIDAVLIYEQVGGDDSTPENDPLIAYIDTDADGLLPLATANGTITLTIADLLRISQA